MANNKGGPKGDQSTIGNGAIAALFLFIFYLLALALWYEKHELIVKIYGSIRMAQSWLMHIVSGIIPTPFADWYTFFHESDPDVVGFAHLIQSSIHFNALGFFIFVIPFAFYIWNKSVKTNPINSNNFAPEKNYNMEQFCKKMEPLHPHMILWRKFNPSSRSLDTGIYRLPDTATQFVVNNRIFTLSAEGNITAIASGARSVFIKELGRRWEGLEKLTKWERVLVAITSARIVASDERVTDAQYRGAIELQERIQKKMWLLTSEHFDVETDSFDFDLPSEVDTCIAAYFNYPLVQNLVKNHAYVYTVIYALVIESRSIGTFPHCNVGWLHIVDRPLNILVNTAGRGTPFTESSAIHAHYLWECSLNDAILEPMIENAIPALETELAKFKPTRIQLEDATKILDDEKIERQNSTEAVRASINQHLFLGMSNFITQSGVISPLGFTLLDSNGNKLFSAICIPDEKPTDEELQRLGVSAGDIQLATNDAKAIIDEIASKVAGNSLFTCCVSELSKLAPVVTLAAQDRLFDMKNVFFAAAGSNTTLNDAFSSCRMKPAEDANSLAQLALQLYHKYPEVRPQVRGVIS
ncbi:hypothetical protein R6242_18930 [Iodobacter sp. CM08]|uniref:secretion/conjugation apparatus DotM-related subunit n=1 Tax=Iodobacter sp. CM08 TaxID=3085902 RepID=UPI0029821784|nr:hypothetical protein [Iodobacter sp. CM08]MDW5418644.1 hypothetical protein [Iodobacter sp. CM08]